MNDGRRERLLGQIYDAAFDPALWVGVMEALIPALGGEAGAITTLDVVTGEGGGITALVPPDTMAIYLSRWAKRNPLHRIDDLASYLANWRLAVIRNEEWLDRETLHRSAYFNEFLVPLRSENGMMVRLALTGTSTTTLNVGRSLRRGMFDNDEIDHARWWQGHLARAVRLSHQMHMHQSALDTIDQLVATTPQCLYFLDMRGRIRRMSLAAEAMLADGSTLYDAGGVLAAKDPEGDRDLHRLIALAGDAASAPAGGGAMWLRGAAGPPCEISVTRLGPRSIAAWSCEPVMLVSVTIGRRQPLPVEMRLRQQFGLTPAECRLTIALAEGGTLREVADRAAVSINTVRSQLGAVFAKTGYRRQSDLIRALLTLDQRQPDEPD